MLIEKNAQYYLKRTRAFAKEVEFDIPDELRAKKDINVNELFPLTIACIVDLSADIVRGKESNEAIKIHKNELYFAAKFYDSYLNLNNNQQVEDSNYFNLVGAIAYYLCDQIGSSLVLIRKVNIETLNLSQSKLDILIYYLLKNEPIIENSLVEENEEENNDNSEQSTQEEIQENIEPEFSLTDYQELEAKYQALLAEHEELVQFKNQIENELQYPGTIKVTVIRETRVTEEAK